MDDNQPGSAKEENHLSSPKEATFVLRLQNWRRAEAITRCSAEMTMERLR